MSQVEPLVQLETHTTSGNAERIDRSKQIEHVDCAVVIVTYNSARDVIGLLESLPAAAAGLTLRTVVVDNGSNDGTLDLVRKRADVTCLEAETNLGYAGGINLGRQHAGSYSTLLVLNPDVLFEPGALRELFAAIGAEPAVGIVTPMLLDTIGHCFPSLRRSPSLTRAIGDSLLGSRLNRRPGWLSEMVWDESQYKHRHSVDWATGAALLISASCDRAVGAWDERYFLYSEETDYATRARTAGFRIEYIPTARVIHRGGGSGQSWALTALMAISRIRYIEKHGNWHRAYRAALILAELLRSKDPGHRTALKLLLRRSRWSSLVSDLQKPACSIAQRSGQ